MHRGKWRSYLLWKYTNCAGNHGIVGKTTIRREKINRRCRINIFSADASIIERIESEYLANIARIKQLTVPNKFAWILQSRRKTDVGTKSTDELRVRRKELKWPFYLSWTVSPRCKTNIFPNFRRLVFEKIEFKNWPNMVWLGYFFFNIVNEFFF